jgi:hypothetical protein
MASRCRTTSVGLLLFSVALTAAAQAPTEFTVTVSNTTMVVNGDTTDIPSLIANPGADGISFLEAFRAANNTQGVKTIAFDSALAGKTIEVTPTTDIRQFVVNTPDLTINGDIDGDGVPDVTLQASNNQMMFVIRDSRFTIRGLRLISNFTGVMIMTECLDNSCQQQEVDGLNIIGNAIFSTLGSAIEISPGFVRPFDLMFLPQLTYKNILISGNEIEVHNIGITITPSVDGVNGAIAQNITIEKNQITAPIGIRAVTADRAAPPFFAANNLIGGLKIDQNTFRSSTTAVIAEAGVQGNSNNRISGLQITGNHIATPNSGLDIAAAADPKPQRVGSGNVIENVVISGNDIAATARGITISGADLPVLQNDSVGLDSNTVRDVSIHDNTISGYNEAGVRLWGGLGNLSTGSLTISRNVIDDVSVMNNVLTAGSRHAVGIAVVGGESRGGTIASDNAVRDLTVSNNRMIGNGTGVFFTGGIGAQARSNIVDIAHFDGNLFDGNDVRVTAAENSNSAGGNTIRFPRRRIVR